MLLEKEKTTKMPGRNCSRVNTDDKLRKAIDILSGERIVSLFLNFKEQQNEKAFINNPSSISNPSSGIATQNQEVLNEARDERTKFPEQIDAVVISSRTHSFTIKIDKIKEKGVLKGILKGKGIIGHNLKNDLNYIYREAGYMPKLLFDTMIASILLSKGAVCGEVGYNEVAEYHLGKEPQKEGKQEQEAGSVKSIVDVMGIVSLKDNAVRSFEMFELYDALANKFINEDVEMVKKISAGHLDVFGIKDPLLALECAFVPVVTGLELKGIGVYISKLKTLMEAEEALLEEKKNKIKVMYGFNPSRHDAAVFFEKEGIKVEKTKKGNLSLTNNFLKTLNHNAAKPLLEMYNTKEIYDTAKRIQNSISPCETVKSSYYQLGSPTGKVISYDPSLQNIKNGTWIKTIFTPGEGRVFIACDFPQIELRINSVYTKEQAMLDNFINKRDPHVATACEITGKKPEDITKQERENAKPCNYGFIYGISDQSFCDYAQTDFGIEMDLNQTRDIRQKFFNTYKRFAQNVSDKYNLFKNVSETTVYSVLGRAMKCLNANQALNYPVSGSCSDLLKLSCIVLRNKLKEKKIRVYMVNLAHDEIVVETSEKEKDIAKDALCWSMAKAAAILNIPLQADEIDTVITKHEKNK